LLSVARARRLSLRLTGSRPESGTAAMPCVRMPYK
jgi:hypothetical protein